MMHPALLKLLFPLLTACCCTSLFGQVINETETLERPHFEIRTSTATYLYDRAGGGFSSIRDMNGIEWIGFKPGNGKVPGSAAADFRGLPNLVFRGDDNGAGHPGFDQCTSSITAHNQVTTESGSGLWKWTWTFSDQEALLEVIETDTGRNYWFLYEGTPGGRFDPGHQFWGNSVDGKRADAPPIGSDQTGNGNWKWAFFGHRDVATTFFVVHVTPDEHNDTFSYMGASGEGIESEDGMVVFGFGRSGGTPLMSGPNRFIIGLHEPETGQDPVESLIEHLNKRNQ